MNIYILLYVCHRQSQSSATKKSPSGDIPQEVTQEANRRPVQRGQSEDMPNTYRSQVIWPLLVIHESVLFKLHMSDIYWSVKQCLFCLALRVSQEFVEMTDMENDSDGGGYPVLEGHGRAASMPRLNAGFQVNISYHHGHMRSFWWELKITAAQPLFLILTKLNPAKKEAAGGGLCTDRGKSSEWAAVWDNGWMEVIGRVY